MSGNERLLSLPPARKQPFRFRPNTAETRLSLDFRNRPIYVIQERKRSARKQSLIRLLGSDLIGPPGRSLAGTEDAAGDLLETFDGIEW